MDAANREIGLTLRRLGPTAIRTRPDRLVGLGVAALFGLPIAAGLVATILPAFGYLPAIGGTSPSLAAWAELAAEPGLATSLRLTVTTGVAATALSLLLAFSLSAALHGRFRGGGGGFLAPFLAAPHAAMAIGLAFVIAPSGWLMRLASPWATGFTRPPDIATLQDPWGAALTLGLVVKELPFLLVVIGAALNQIPVARQMQAGRALGYGAGIVWMKVIAPQVYAQIRLPVYVVLAFSLSVADMALILAPVTPPPLAVLALRWFAAPDVTRHFPAAAAATLQLFIVVAAIGLWRLGEIAAGRIGLAWCERGSRGVSGEPGLRLAAGLGLAVFALGAAALAALALWSFTWRWPFPDALPSWSLDVWRRQAGAMAWPLGNTVALAVSTSLAALVLAIAWLEAEDRATGAAGLRHVDAGAALPRLSSPGGAALRFVYVPLLIPQIAFLFGAQVLLVVAGADGTFLAVAWSHLIYVFPYLVLALADPWKALDGRYARTAASLGASPTRILFRVKLPILLRPILVAVAIGFSVSVAQYLPTLFAGGGRVATMTTEAVTLASGADRRVVAVLALTQSLVPLAVFAAALLLPRLVQADRRGLGGPA
jgi:putative thiamine transport system permease protein